MGWWQVQKHPLVPDRAAELPSVSPAVCGKPNRHSYAAASRVVGPPNWGALQVNVQGNHQRISCFLFTKLAPLDERTRPFLHCVCFVLSKTTGMQNALK